MTDREKLIKLSKFDSELRKECRFKWCIFPDKATCSEKIIKAHSIQKNRILNYIADNGMIITYDPVKSFISNDFEEQGINAASTFSGFCNNHDICVFSEIENKDYYETAQQNFLFAYRACAREYVIKQESVCFHLKLARNYRIFPSYIPMLHRSLEESKQGLIDMQDHLDKFNSEFLKETKNRNYNLVSTKIFKLNYVSLIAVNSIFNLIYNFKGKIINDLYDFSKRPSPLFLNIFPQQNKTYILLSCFTTNYKIYYDVFSQADTFNNSELENLFSQLILVHCENTFLSPKKWKNLSIDERREIVLFFKRTMNTLKKTYLSQEAPVNLFQLLKK